jgi:hypothetical protein
MFFITVFFFFSINVLIKYFFIFFLHIFQLY